MDTIVAHLKIHFDLSLGMLVNLIAYCPDELWDNKAGGFVFWQQLLHAFAGIDFWTRTGKGKFIEPFYDRQLFPELEKPPIGELSKGELSKYSQKIRAQTIDFFKDKDDEWLARPNLVYGKVLNVDIIEMQIRHIQYHVGHCNSILREKGVKAVEWEDYYG